MFLLRKIIIMLIIILATPALLTGCGGSSYNEDETSSTTDSSTSDSSDSSDSDDDDDDDDDEDEDEIDFSAALSYEFELTGYEETETFEVQTDSILTIKALPGNGILTVDDTGYNFQYTCTKYSIEVNGYTVQTNYLAVNGATRYASDWNLSWYSDPCENADTEQVIDLAGYIGTGDEEITVSAVQTDYKCKNVDYWAWYSWGPSNCGQMSSTYESHNVTGQILVLVNGS